MQIGRLHAWLSRMRSVKENGSSVRGLSAAGRRQGDWLLRRCDRHHHRLRDRMVRMASAKHRGEEKQAGEYEHDHDYVRRLGRLRDRTLL